MTKMLAEDVMSTTKERQPNEKAWNYIFLEEKNENHHLARNDIGVAAEIGKDK